MYKGILLVQCAWFHSIVSGMLYPLNPAWYPINACKSLFMIAVCILFSYSVTYETVCVSDKKQKGIIYNILSNLNVLKSIIFIYV